MTNASQIIHQKALGARPGTIHDPTSFILQTILGINDLTNAAVAPFQRSVVALLGNLAEFHADNTYRQCFIFKNAAGENVRTVEIVSVLDVGTDGAESGHLEIRVVRPSDGEIVATLAIYPDHINLPSAAADPTVGIQDGSLYYNTTTDKLKIRANGAWETVTSA